MLPAETCKLAAIMFTDMVGFSRQMGADEARTLRLLALHNQVIEHAVATHQGHIIKTAGDSFLIEFSSTSSYLFYRADRHRFLCAVVKRLDG